MIDSPNNPEKTQRGPGRRIKHWNHRQTARVMGATGGNVKNNSIDKLAEATAGERTPAETRARGQNIGDTRATGVRMKWQDDGTGGSLVYIKFLHNL